MELRSCSFNQANISTFTSESEGIRILNSTVYYTIFNARAGYDGIEVIDSILRNFTVINDGNSATFKITTSNAINGTIAFTSLTTTIVSSVVRDVVFSSANPWASSSAFYFQNSTMNNISINGYLPSGTWFYQNFLFSVSIRNCSFNLGTIIFHRYMRSSIIMRDSTLNKVNITTIVPNDNNYYDYNYGSLIVRNTEFTHGVLYVPSMTADVTYTNITLAQTPFAMSRNSRIVCSSIGRSGLIPQANTIGLNVTSITVQNSTIKNFATGIRINPWDIYSVNISRTNFQSISQIYVDNKGYGDVVATGNYWGTNNVVVIQGNIIDYWDDIHYGEVLFNNYAPSSLAAETGCAAYDSTVYDPALQTTSPYYGK